MEVIPEDVLHKSWHLIEPSGERLVGAPAAIALMEHVSLTRKLGRLLRRLDLYWLVGAVDRVLKTQRGRLSRIVPDVRPPHRPP